MRSPPRSRSNSALQHSALPLLLPLLLALCRPACAQWAGYTVPLSGQSLNNVSPNTEAAVIRAVASLQAAPSVAGTPALPSAFYVGGSWVGSTLWNNTKRADPLAAPADNIATGADAVGALINNGGSVAWSFKLASSGDDYITDVTVVSSNTQSGSAVFSGVMGGSINNVGLVAALNGSSAWSLGNSFPSATPAGFLIAVSSAGSLLWTRRVGGTLQTSNLGNVPTAWPWSLVEAGSTLKPYSTDGAFAVAVNGQSEVFVATQVGPAASAFADDSFSMFSSSIETRARIGFDAVLGKACRCGLCGHGAAASHRADAPCLTFACARSSTRLAASCGTSV